MAKLKSGTRIYGTATIDTSVVVGSAVTANSSGIQVAGIVTATQLVSTVATGTAPFVIASATVVTNLNADLLDGLNSATTNTGATIVARDGSGNFSAGTITASLTGAASLNVLKAGDTMTGQLISTLANSTTTGGGQIYLNGATGNRIDFNGNGLAAPSIVTRSVGTKIVFWPGLSNVNVDYALGMESATMWSSVESSSAQFKWYAGTTNIATLGGTGNLSITGIVTATQLVSTVATGTAPFTVTSTTVVPNLNVSFLQGYQTATANTINSIVLRDGSGNFSAGTITASLTGAASLNVLKAGDTMTGQLISTLANSTTTGGGQIYLNGATGNRIDFNTSGTGAPTLTTRSVGTKIVLYPAVSGAGVDAAFGIDNANLWSSVTSSAEQFRWYAGTTNIATLFGTGELVVGTTTKTGTASQPLQVTGGAYVSGNLGIGSTNPTTALDVNGILSFSRNSTVRIGNSLTGGGSSGIRNVVIGAAAGGSNTSGNDNVYVGQGAGYWNTSGSRNVYIGPLTSSSGSSTTSEKVIIGTGFPSGTGSGSGSFFDAPSPTKSTQLAIGIVDSGSQSRYWLVGDENFNVGIGTTNPTSKFYVVGNAYISGISTLTQISAGGTVGTAGSILSSTGTGLSWIPAASGGTAYATSAGIATYATTAGVSTSVIGGIGSITQLQVTGISTFTNGPVLVGAATSTGTALQRLQVTDGAYVSGSLGVGVTNPSSKIDVSGDIAIRATDSATQKFTINFNEATDSLDFDYTS
jgi:hypothetical protein